MAPKLISILACMIYRILISFLFHLQEYMQRKLELVKVERHLLRTFGFVLHVDHPHKVILHYLNLLKVNQAMKQESWNLANDRYVIEGSFSPSFKTHWHADISVATSFPAIRWLPWLLTIMR